MQMQEECLCEKQRVVSEHEFLRTYGEYGEFPPPKKFE